MKRNSHVDALTKLLKEKNSPEVAAKSLAVLGEAVPDKNVRVHYNSTDGWQIECYQVGMAIRVCVRAKSFQAVVRKAVRAFLKVIEAENKFSDLELYD